MYCFPQTVAATGIYDKLRPIVKDELIGGSCIGEEFNKVIQFSQILEISSDPTSEVQISDAYGEIEQVADLKVLSMPRGSYTTIEELHERTKSVHRKKRKGKDNNDVTNKQDDLEDKKVHKKAKKDKKEANSKSEDIQLSSQNAESKAEKKEKKR